MIDMELNNRINALWTQFPSEVVDRLQEKFYGYITTGKADRLKQLVDENPLMKEIAQTDPSIIWGAAIEYDYDLLKYMVHDLKLDVNFRKQEAINRTLLLEVLHHHHSKHQNVNISKEQKFQLKYQTVKMLISLDADLKAVDYLGNNALHYAISELIFSDLLELENATIIIELLLYMGTNPNQQNRQGQTPLYTLLSKNKIRLDYLQPIIKLLVESGADETIADENGITPKILLLHRSPIANIAGQLNKYLSSP